MTKRQTFITNVKKLGAIHKEEYNSLKNNIQELIDSDEIPVEWRKIDNNELINFVLKNRALSIEELKNELKKHDANSH